MLNKEDRDIIMYAMRYSLNRETGALVDCIKYYKDRIDSFDPWEIQVLLDDVEFNLKIQNKNNVNNKTLTKFAEYLKEKVNL